jgi:hypothetical protein
MYAIAANIRRATGNDEYLHVSVPTFYLNPDMQGIVDEHHARKIAQDILNPFGDEHVECFITVVEV